jgi:enoyl-CoA hydratase/carnithine racemase
LSENDHVQLEVRGAALWLTLTRPKAMNSLTPQIVAGIEEAGDRAAGDPEIRALVITGSGRAFSAGADLTAVPEVSAEPGGTDDFRNFLAVSGQAFARLESLSCPTIAAVNGIALAGGLELALACDIIVAAEGARMGDAHAKYGQFPGGGGSVRLPARVGNSYAKFMMLTGAVIDGREAEQRGLAELVVPDDELVPTVDKLVESIASSSALGLSLMKRQLAPSTETAEVRILRERDIAVDFALSADRNEGLAAFNEGRTPVFTGR